LGESPLSHFSVGLLGLHLLHFLIQLPHHRLVSLIIGGTSQLGYIFA
jgi:hypothetical protein